MEDKKVSELTNEEIAELYCDKCLRPRHADWVKAMAKSPAHPGMARVIELSICAQYQLDDVKAGKHAGGSTIKTSEFQGA